jgi:hypothetical protein
MNYVYDIKTDESEFIISLEDSDAFFCVMMQLQFRIRGCENYTDNIDLISF